MGNDWNGIVCPAIHRPDGSDHYGTVIVVVARNPATITMTLKVDTAGVEAGRTKGSNRQ